MTVLDSTSQQPTPVSLYPSPFGRPAVVAELAGPYIQDLVAEGESALIQAATQALVEAFGGDIRGRIFQSTSTQWAADEHVLGAYSYAKAGYASDRLALSHPIGDRIFLAGEAVSTDAYASCHGAFQSGMDAVDKALKSIRA